MRLPTPQRICTNKSPSLFNEYFKFTNAKNDWFKSSPSYKQVFLYDKSRKGQVSGYKLVEVSNGCLNTTVFVYVTPSLRFPVQFHRSIGSSCSDLKYRSYIILLGLTAGLVSLGSLWLYDFLEISAVSSKSLDESQTDFGTQLNSIGKYNSNNADLVKIYPTFISNQIDFFANPEGVDQKPRNQFTSEQIISPEKQQHEFKKSAQNLIVSEENESNSVCECTTKPYFDLIDSSLNCTHFLSDTGQICLLCWLNMPDYWLHNPSWINTFTSVYENSSKSSTHLLGFIICVQLIFKTLYFIYEKTIKQLFQQKNDINHNNNNNQSNNQQIQVESMKSVPIHKHVRLSGDGAPSTHTPVQLQLAEEEKYRNSYNRPRYSLDTFEYDAHTNLCKTHSVQSVCQNDILSNSYHNINTYDADSEISAIHFDNNNNTNIANNNNNPNNTAYNHNNNNNRNECCDSTTNRLLSKILKVLSIKQIDNSISSNRFPVRYLHSDPNLRKQFEQNNEIAQRLTSSQPNSTTHNYHLNLNDYPRKHKRLHLLRSYRQSGSDSPSLSVDSDGFEYDDELITCFNFEKLSENKNSTEQLENEINLIDNNDADDEADEDEINLTHLFDTFNSLINTQSDLNRSNTEIGEKNHNSDTNNISRFESKGFSDLTEKANKLTNELNNLEITLDRLLYKLQANQIQLDQAESNLDYVWHLRDNLDNSSSDCESYLPDSTDVDNDLNTNTKQQSSIEVYSKFHESDEKNLIPSIDYHILSDNDIDDHIIENSENQLIKSDDSFSQEIHCSTMFDSGFDQSIICPNQDLSSMTKSMPEIQLSHNQNSSSLSKSLSSKYSRHCPYSRSLRSHKRFKSRIDDKRRSDLGNYRFSTEIYPDSDGFLHPDLTFDKDGIFDWTEPMCISTEQ